MNKLTYEKFELIIEKYYNVLIRIAYNYVRDSFYAADAVHDAFAKLYQTHKRFESAEHVKNWLIRVTINNCLNMIKYKDKELAFGDGFIDNYAAVQNDDEKDEQRKIVYDCICSLKDNYKNILFLYYYDDYSLKDIAKILAISESNASSRLVRARNKLKMKVLERRKTNV